MNFYSELFMVSLNTHNMVIAKLKFYSCRIGSVQVVNIGLA